MVKAKIGQHWSKDCFQYSTATAGLSRQVDGLVLTSEDVKALGLFAAHQDPPEVLHTEDLTDLNVALNGKHVKKQRVLPISAKSLCRCCSGRDADKDGSGLISAKELYKAIIQGEADGTGRVRSCHVTSFSCVQLSLFKGSLELSEKRRRGIDRRGKPMTISVEIDRRR